MQPEIAPPEKQTNSDCKITLYLKISCCSWIFSHDIKNWLESTISQRACFALLFLRSSTDIPKIEKLKQQFTAHFLLRIFHATWNCPCEKTNECRLHNNLIKYKNNLPSWTFSLTIKKLNWNQQFHKKFVLRCYF